MDRFVCQNYQQECEDGINKQIDMQLYSSSVYLSLFFYFDRDDVALHHLAEFFRKRAREQREQAEKLMEFQKRRGGRILLADIQRPEQDGWGNVLEAMKRALQLEKDVNQSLLDLHKRSAQHADPQLRDFLESCCLDQQVRIIRELGEHITNLERHGSAWESSRLTSSPWIDEV